MYTCIGDSKMVKTNHLPTRFTYHSLALFIITYVQLRLKSMLDQKLIRDHVNHVI